MTDGDRREPEEASPFSGTTGEASVLLAKILELHMADAHKRDAEAATRQAALMELIARTSETKEDRDKKAKDEQQNVRKKEEQYRIERRDRKRATLSHQLQKWDDTVDVEIFLKNFEEVMTEGEYEEEEWLRILRKYLTGKALQVYTQVTTPGATTFSQVKDALVERLGTSIQQSRKRIWLSKPKTEESPRTFLEPIIQAIAKVKRGITDPEKAAEELFQGVLLSAYSKETLLYLKQSKGNQYQIMETLQDLWEAKAPHDKRRMLRTPPDNTQQPYQQPWRRDTRQDSGRRDGQQQTPQQHRDGGESPVVKGGGKPYRRDGSGDGRPYTSDHNSGRRAPQSVGNREITCFNCQKTGHMRYECPENKVKLNRIKMLTNNYEEPKFEAMVNDVRCTAHVDTGADITGIPPHLVTQKHLTGLYYNVETSTKQSQLLREAEVMMEVDGQCTKQCVVILPEGAKVILLGKDHRLAREALDSLKRPRVNMCAITRAQSQAQQAELRENDRLDAESGALPHPMSLNPNSKPVPKPRQLKSKPVPKPRRCKPTEGTLPVHAPLPTPPKAPAQSTPASSPRVDPTQEREGMAESEEDEEEVDEEEVDEEDEAEEEGNGEDWLTVGSERDGEQMSDLPLPVLANDKEELRELRQLQQEDGSLSDMRKRAKKGDKGYGYNDGILIQTIFQDPGQEWVRVVVPKLRRREVLDAGHRGLAGGHFSHNRMTGSIRRSFTWPGMIRDVRRYCSQCPECQKAGRPLPPRAPMVTMPIISVPYERLACDLVGPLVRSKSGYKYILSVICVGTRYPYCVPLKRVDALTVAEGLMEVLSHTGIPKELLTDRGTVFTGKVMRETCRLLGVDKIQTSPYHPESNGVLERWHRDLKLMLRKHPNCKDEWDKLLKYCLLSFRASPHSSTGFSPFELVNGRNLRGPLEAIKESWLSGEVKFHSVVEWVEELRETLARLHGRAEGNERLAKEKSKEYYDKKARERSFELGEMALVHTPSISGKLDNVWEGPFEIIDKLSNTTYKLAVPDRRSHTQTAHINRLKKWVTPRANLYRLVVADEVEGDEQALGKVKMGEPVTTPEQRAQLDKLLDEFKGTVTKELGRNLETTHTINTGSGQPVRSHPNRVAPAWKDQLKEQVYEMVGNGILIPSQSPWSSAMVPVRKPNGDIRLCIDYRKLNGVTEPDPYMMPRIQDLLDKLSQAKWLSKIDLNKGFYQIPLDPDSIHKTAFCSPWGKFSFTRMPFGLMNAPASFQRCMDEALAGQEDWSATYIDDIVIFSNTWEEHLLHVRKVLQALEKVGMTANPDKCVWGARTLTYLGHQVGGGAVTVPEARVAAIRNFRQPITKKDLRAFLGSVGHYRAFIPEFAGRAVPLYNALKKAAPSKLCWDGGMLQAFEFFLQALCSHRVLWLPREDDDFLLQTDASHLGLGGVLSVVRDGTERPVGYFSKKLLPAEKNYTITELECLAVVRAVDHFGVYLLATKPFKLVTDHRALKALKTSSKLSGRVMRWAMALQPYNYEVIYRKGSLNGNADGLSRQAWEDAETETEKDPTSTTEGVDFEEGEM